MIRYMTRPVKKNTHRSWLLILLLSGSFTLLSLLSWQAYHSVQQQRDVAQKVLLEYAQLAAEEFSRRIMPDVGYRGYFLELNRWYQEIKLLTDKASITRMTNFECHNLTSDNLAQFHYWTYHKEIVFSNTNCGDIELHAFIRKKISQFDILKLENAPYAVIHTGYLNRSLSITIAKRNKQIYGFIVDPEKLRQVLVQSFEKSPLLPKALASGKATNEMIDLSMADHLNRNIIKARNLYPSKLQAKKKLTTEYNNIFDQYTIMVTINPDAMQQLIIGGLPSNNLPIVILTLLSTLIVFIISLIQIRKEKNLNRLRENFVAEVSHELRTPLTQIRMFAEMLFLNKSRDDIETKKYIEIIHRESLRLNHLIDNILKYSQTNSTKSQELDLPLEPQNIASIIADAVSEIEPIARQKKVVIDTNLINFDIPVEYHSIKRIMINLLDNAIKYGPDNQVIIVNTQLNSDPLNFRIQVSDQGPGIPKSELKNIWLPYYRLPIERNKAIAGTGIGLYLIKQLAEKNLAEVWVEPIYSNDKLPKGNSTGSCFIIEWSNLKSQSTSTKTIV